MKDKISACFVFIWMLNGCASISYQEYPANWPEIFRQGSEDCLQIDGQYLAVSDPFYSADSTCHEVFHRSRIVGKVDFSCLSLPDALGTLGEVTPYTVIQIDQEPNRLTVIFSDKRGYQRKSSLKKQVDYECKANSISITKPFLRLSRNIGIGKNQLSRSFYKGVDNSLLYEEYYSDYSILFLPPLPITEHNRKWARWKIVSQSEPHMQNHLIYPESGRAIQTQEDKYLQLYYKMIDINKAEAHQWLCKSADGGYPDARFRLALLYEHGHEGIVQSSVYAYLWYVLAAQSGSYWGEKNAFRLKNDILTLESIDSAEQLIKKWKPGQCEIDLRFTEN